MKLIIDIPEYVYKACLGHRDVVYQYIANGTPYEERPQAEKIEELIDNAPTITPENALMNKLKYEGEADND